MTLLNFIFLNFCCFNYATVICSATESIKRTKNPDKYIEQKSTTQQLNQDRFGEKYNFYNNAYNLAPKQNDDFYRTTEILYNDSSKNSVQELNCSVGNNSKRCFSLLATAPMYMSLTKSPTIISFNKNRNKHKLYELSNNISTISTPHLTTDFTFDLFQEDSPDKIFPANGIGHEYATPQDATFQINSPVKSKTITVSYEEAGSKQYFVPINEIKNNHTIQENIYLSIHSDYFKPTISTLNKKPNYFHNSTSKISGIGKKFFDERFDSQHNHGLLGNHPSHSYSKLHDYTARQNSPFQLSKPENATRDFNSISKISGISKQYFDELHDAQHSYRMLRNHSLHSYPKLYGHTVGQSSAFQLSKPENVTRYPNSKVQEDGDNTPSRQTRYTFYEEQRIVTPIFGSLMHSKRTKRQVPYQAYQFMQVNAPPDVSEQPVERFNIEIHYEQTQVTPILCSKAPDKLPSLTDYFPPKIGNDAGPPVAGGGKQAPVQVYRQIEISDAMLGAGLDLAKLFEGVTVRDVYVTVPVTVKSSSAPPPKPTQRKRPKPPPTRKKITTTSPTTTFRTDEYETDDYETETIEPEEYYSHGPDTDIISDQYYVGDGITTIRAPSRGKRSWRKNRNHEKSNNTFISYESPVHVLYRTGL